MENKSSSKSTVKKQSVGSDKQKKSTNSKKKKKAKKPNSASGTTKQSPDPLEVEGVQALDQQGAESDSSSTRNQTENLQKNSEVPNKSDPAGKSSPLVTPSNSSQSKDTYLTNLKKNGGSSTSLEETMSNLSVRSKSSPQRGSSKGKLNSVKSGASGSNLASKSNSRQTGKTNDTSKLTVKTNDTSKLTVKTNDTSKVKGDKKTEESLRWDNVMQDEEKETERIRIYKINRRKRYLAAAQAKGLSWVVNYGNNGMPVCEEPRTESSELEIHTTTVTDFSTVRGLISSSHKATPLGVHSRDYVC